MQKSYTFNHLTKSITLKTSPMRRFILLSGILLGLPVIVLLALIGYASITNYNPPGSEQLSLDTPADTLPDSASFRVMIWNIGYAGLDKDMDFFYDGGQNVRTPENRLRQNLAGILHTLAGTDSTDFILLQEVDRKSKRSYGINQVQMLSDFWHDRTFFGKNYDVFFVPLPFTEPMGRVNSGLLSFSRHTPSSVERLSLPGTYPWPKQLFMLDRCLLVMHYPVSNGRELLVVNVHHEAYDNGDIRDKQMAYLKEFLIRESEKGNYLVVAGDWNQCPPDLEPAFEGDIFDTIDHKAIDPSYLPGEWQWVFDNRVPTNRRVDVPYIRGKTRTTLIDFFLVSPNLRVSGCKAGQMGFTFSDHQPVQVNISFR